MFFTGSRIPSSSRSSSSSMPDVDNSCAAATFSSTLYQIPAVKRISLLHNWTQIGQQQMLESYCGNSELTGTRPTGCSHKGSPPVYYYYIALLLMSRIEQTTTWFILK
ncbi:hypothetical protein U9M48_036514 [Paspalum notatum var. saurae]|uniref:Uncharacterized protein n=1 Tax=Paspalum notatum var. saurae TaxID=547442 RepID=A0AAQ3UHD7_PASNO